MITEKNPFHFKMVSNLKMMNLLLPKMTLHANEKSAGHGASTIALKSMGRVIRSLKQRVPVAPQTRG